MFKDVWSDAFLFDAEGDAGGGSSSAAEGSKDGDPNAGTSDTGKADDKDKVPFHEHPRWKEVHGDRTAIREVIGDMTPDQLATAMRDLREFYAVVNAPDADPEPKKDPVKPGSDEEKREELKKEAIVQLEALSPGITKSYGRIDAQFKALSRRADRATSDIMKEAKYDEKDRGWLSKTIIEILNEREELWDDYITGSVKDAVKGAWRVLQERLRVEKDTDKRAEKLRAAKTSQTLPRTHRGGGSADLAGGEPVKRPTNLKDAGKSALAKLEEAED